MLTTPIPHDSRPDRPLRRHRQRSLYVLLCPPYPCPYSLDTPLITSYSLPITSMQMMMSPLSRRSSRLLPLPALPPLLPRPLLSSHLLRPPSLQPPTPRPPQPVRFFLTSRRTSPSRARPQTVAETPWPVRVWALLQVEEEAAVGAET